MTEALILNFILVEILCCMNSVSYSGSIAFAFEKSKSVLMSIVTYSRISKRSLNLFELYKMQFHFGGTIPMQR